jgi:hypothetical protein
MAITAVLIYAGHNRLRYFINATAGGGEQVEIQSDGGATPDLQTDSLAGPIKQISLVKAQGYGKIAAGGISSTAEARALLLSDGNASIVGPNNPTAITRFAQRTGVAVPFVVDAAQGSGDAATPSLYVTALAIGSCELEISIPGGIGA